MQLNGLKKVIEGETNINNLNNIIKMAKESNLDDIVKLCKKRIKQLEKIEQEKIKKELDIEDNKIGWRKNTHKCARCGKEIDFEFRSKEIWGWKLGKQIFCSYSCYSKTFDERNKKRNK